MDIKDDIIKLKGVGEKTAPLYEKIGIDTMDDLIHYYPRDYIRYDMISNPSDFTNGTVVAFVGTVLARPLVKKVRRLNITSVKLSATGALVTATWFHMPFLPKMLTVGKQYVFRGTITTQGDHFHIEQPAIFGVDAYKEIENKIAPIYSLTKGLTNNALTKSVRKAFDELNPNDYEDGLINMHFPENEEILKHIRGNLVYDEFLLFILRLRLLKEENNSSCNSFNIIEVSETNRLIERLPYRLTNAQARVWNEIKEDLCQNKSMSRLVQGDVGSGKTILAVLASLMVAVNNYQVAMMAPTEILANQHFELFSKLFKENNLNIKIVLLTGSMTAATKRKIRQEIESGEAKIIIGTHALIQEKVIYNNLALVVTDEQHRFGVNQRETLSKKNLNDSVHVLVMSATPIPRTLAIILYGDLSVSTIDEVPAHKLPIKNAVVDINYRQKAYDFIKKEVRAGHQAYVICPLVEESEGLDAKDAVGYAKELSTVFEEDIRIGCLHGKMRPAEKNKVMNDFANNNIQILVSTTVVEVGVNVPNATVMMVENADRFGLAQLHQLRGRIGRGAAQSYCIFISGNANKKTMERLDILKNSNDGFEIAQKDLDIRGPGDMFGIRQSGEMQFRLADIFTDAAILQKASQEADRILRDDPQLKKEEHQKLKFMIEKSFTESDIEKTI